MHDTSPEMQEKIYELIRAKTPFERFQMGCSMLSTSRYLIIRALREENPNISNAELRQQLFLKFYGEEFSEAQKAKILAHLSHFEGVLHP
jgi:hypothetical protein